MNFKTIAEAVTRTAGRQILVTKKHSPTLLLGAGIVGVVATAVLASRATLKLEDVIDEHQQLLTKADFRHDLNPEKYTEEDQIRDKTIIMTRMVVEITRLYAPAIFVGAASIAAMTGSHIILQRRNVALTAAYATVQTAFNKYRERVVGELGPQRDAEFMYGYEEREIVEETPSGPVVKKVRHPGGHSMYARFFDETCLRWDKRPEYNALVVRCQQNYANDLLRSRGHVFLNEVYEMLGMPHTKEGSVVGWINNSPEGDGYIDFGVFDGDSFTAMRFVTGEAPGILLDFNVDGVIYDKI